MRDGDPVRQGVVVPPAPEAERRLRVAEAPEPFQIVLINYAAKSGRFTASKSRNRMRSARPRSSRIFRRSHRVPVDAPRRRRRPNIRAVRARNALGFIDVDAIDHLAPYFATTWKRSYTMAVCRQCTRTSARYGSIMSVAKASIRAQPAAQAPRKGRAACCARDPAQPTTPASCRRRRSPLRSHAPSESRTRRSPSGGHARETPTSRASPGLPTDRARVDG